MSNRKSIGLIILLLIVVVGVLWLQNHRSPEIQHKGVVISSWNSGMGAVSENAINFDMQKLSFTANIWNDSTEQSYVKVVKMHLPDSLRSRILSGDTIFQINQLLNPNANYQVTGELILDTKGMTKQDIVSLGSIQGFAVETEKN